MDESAKVDKGAKEDPRLLRHPSSTTTVKVDKVAKVDPRLLLHPSSTAMSTLAPEAARVGKIYLAKALEERYVYNLPRI